MVLYDTSVDETIPLTRLGCRENMAGVSINTDHLSRNLNILKRSPKKTKILIEYNIVAKNFWTLSETRAKKDETLPPHSFPSKKQNPNHYYISCIDCETVIIPSLLAVSSSKIKERAATSLLERLRL